MSESEVEEDKLKKYRDADIRKIHVHYAGGGDDGCIEEVEVEEGEGELTPEMKDEIESFVYDVLNDFPDWYNNEGGYGNIYINIAKDRMEINHNVYYENSETDALEYDEETGGKVKELKKLLLSLPSTVAKVLCNAQNEEEMELRFITEGGRQAKGIDEEVRESIRALFDELADSAIWDCSGYEEGNWYNYEVVFDCFEKTFESASLRYTTRTEEGTTTYLTFSNAEEYEGDHDD